MLIGPTFVDELKAAGAPLDGLSWGADGAIVYSPSYQAADKLIVQAVLAAHNPNGPAAHNFAIDAQIDALERESMIPRPVREGLLLVWQAVAQLLNWATLAQLLDPTPGNTKYHAGFAKAYAFNQSIVALRAQREPVP